ncbi:hypothetical protein BVRB_036180, partial [Beta vulgaris subsp. vulgaris]
VWPLVAGIGVAGALVGGKLARQAYKDWLKKRGGTLLGPGFYEGGFEAQVISLFPYNRRC